MGLNRIREDSVADLRKKKSMQKLQKENEQLKAQVDGLNVQITDTQLALCDVYELLAVGASSDVSGT